MTAISEADRSYDKIKDFLIDRYAAVDEYIERIGFFDVKFSAPPEKFAATLNNLFDLFQEKKEEILVAKFISATTGKLSEELRLRRPGSLSKCVQISNSISTSYPYSCSLVNKPNHGELSFAKKEKSRYHIRGTSTDIVCFCCGRPNHKAKDENCPAKNAICRVCMKKGHFALVCKSAKFKKDSTATVHVSSLEMKLIQMSYGDMYKDQLFNCELRVALQWISL